MQQPWFTQQWYHGDHSYFYWLVEVQVCPCYATCPVCSSQQPPGKKMSTTQKWLRGERWNVRRACHATVLACFTSQISCHCCHSYSYLVFCSMDFKVDSHWVSMFQYWVMNSFGHAVNQCVVKHSNQSLNVVVSVCVLYLHRVTITLTFLRFMVKRMLSRTVVLRLRSRFHHDCARR